ncbi:MAG: cytochrome c biogenesis protein CcsA [Planctomycetes bacterium]|nr:cytochrome c biogenesis protein CcsA [Planctomycetota bacterium]
MTSASRLIPWVVVLALGGWLAKNAVPPRDAAGEMQVQEFGRLPVVYQGRVKPFDTLARNGLVIISDRQTWRDAENKRRPAIEWLLDVMAETEGAYEHKVFRIVNLQLLDTLGLERRPGYRYAFNEFQSKLRQLDEQAGRIARLERQQRDAYANQVLEFSSKVRLFHLLMRSHRIPEIDRDGDEQAMRSALSREIALWRSIEGREPPHAVPPHGENDEWKPFLFAALRAEVSGHADPAVEHLAGMLRAHKLSDVAAFNDALVDYKAFLASHPLKEQPALGFEAMFNHFEPFYRCSALYIVALVLGFFSWLGFSKVLNRTAFWLMFLTFAVHTWALIARIYISGYPPITNLYGTAVFIGWGAVLLGLILEVIYALGIGNLIAAASGFLTLLIAHFLAGDGDTLEMMQAVLDTKFWLATHVIIINFGYAATFLAGGLAVIYVLRGVLTRSLDKHTEGIFYRMIYGIICFGMLLSFVGTVLGGLWADDSWGRFWGWDPKENGALMIVLWNALILHARWGGMVKARGIAVLAIFGSIVTSWSWFGVNQLGVGLHSYGFTDSVAFWLLLFVLCQLTFMGVGLWPRARWRSAASLSQQVAKRVDGPRRSTERPPRNRPRPAQA